MCTAADLLIKDFYFGRTLDYSHGFGEEIAVTPRNYPFTFRSGVKMAKHHAIIGMARVEDGYPLYFDAANECGLAMAGLNFTKSARYFPPKEGMDNLAQFELLPWILGRCENLQQARQMLGRINITNEGFKPGMPPSSLHWMIADRSGCIVVESMADGLHIYENPVHVMTNEPPFEWQMENLRKHEGKETPGGLSSESRFLRVAEARRKIVPGEGEMESVGAFFDILGTVNCVNGLWMREDGDFQITIYTACINASRGVYYYHCRNNRRISAVDMYKTDLEGKSIARYALNREQDIMMQN